MSTRSVEPLKAISNESRVVEYYADWLINILAIMMYSAVLAIVYYLWEEDQKADEKGPCSNRFHFGFRNSNYTNPCIGSL